MSEQSSQLIREVSPTVLPGDSLMPLEAILCTEELKRRPSRPPDYQAENRALTALAQALAYSPQTILQTLVDTILEVFKADSAGLSLLTKDEKSFYWPAIAGMWQSHVGGGTPCDFGPCGDVLDRNASLLFRHPERRYPYLLAAMPPAEEVLLVPFYVEGKAVGTIWAIAHDDRRKFDAEDLRQLESLGRFAAAAYRAVAGGEALRQSHTEVAERVAELQDARRAALNLMEDAVQSRHAMEKLNAALCESEERYRTLFESAPMAVFACDRNAVIQHYNRRAAELWGREPVCGVEQYCGSVKLWLPDGTLLPHAESPIAEVLRAGIPVFNAEVFIEQPDGSRLPVVVNFAPLRSAEGEITGAITSFVDITERKRAEGLKAAQMRALELTVANAPLAEVLETLVRTIEAQSPSAMLGSILLLDSNGVHLRHGAAPSLAEEYNSAIDGIAIGPGVGSCGTAAFTKKPVYVSDIAADPLWADFRDLAQCHGLRACWSAPIMSGSGNVLGTFAMYYREPREPTALDLELVNVATRTAALIIERKHAEAEQERLASIVEASPDFIGFATMEGETVYVNAAGRELVGLDDIEEVRRARILDYLMPEWRETFAKDVLPNVLATGQWDGEVTFRHFKTGAPIAVWQTIRTAPDPQTGEQCFTTIARDITERKRAEQRQQLLMNELNHRVKNTLATVQSIAAQSLKGASDPELQQTFDARLVSLSRTHDLLLRKTWESASLRDLLLLELEPYRSEESTRFVIEGPELTVYPKVALALGLAFHELATNAAKYGALSKPTGQVRVAWDVLRSSEQSTLRLKWTETGGPPVKKTGRKGFGSTVIERGLSLDLDGEAKIDLDPSGLVFTVDIPLAAAAWGVAYGR